MDYMSRRFRNWFKQPRTRCHACEGRGHNVMVLWMGGSVVTQCPACEGTGRVRGAPLVCTV